MHRGHPWADDGAGLSTRASARALASTSVAGASPSAVTRDGRREGGRAALLAGSARAGDPALATVFRRGRHVGARRSRHAALAGAAGTALSAASRRRGRAAWAAGACGVRGSAVAAGADRAAIPAAASTRSDAGVTARAGRGHSGFSAAAHGDHESRDQDKRQVPIRSRHRHAQQNTPPASGRVRARPKQSPGCAPAHALPHPPAERAASPQRVDSTQLTTGA